MSLVTQTSEEYVAAAALPLCLSDCGLSRVYRRLSYLDHSSQLPYQQSQLDSPLTDVSQAALVSRLDGAVRGGRYATYVSASRSTRNATCKSSLEGRHESRAARRPTAQAPPVPVPVCGADVRGECERAELIVEQKGVNCRNAATFCALDLAPYGVRSRTVHDIIE